jgi:hypothetical protein
LLERRMSGTSEAEAECRMRVRLKAKTNVGIDGVREYVCHGVEVEV